MQPREPDPGAPPPHPPVGPAEASTAPALNLLAAVFVAIDLLGVGWWGFFGLGYSPSFISMFADFGAELPLATVLVAHPAFGLTMATALLGAVVATSVFVRSPFRRAVTLGALFVGNLVVVALAVTALYLPIFALSRTLR